MFLAPDKSGDHVLIFFLFISPFLRISVHYRRKLHFISYITPFLKQRFSHHPVLLLLPSLPSAPSPPPFGRPPTSFRETNDPTVLSFPFCQMFATIFFSIISFHAKQAYNYGSINNNRTARFLHSIRWVTFSAQVRRNKKKKAVATTVE